MDDYRAPENSKEMVVPRVETGVFRKMSHAERKTDAAIQSAQTAIMASMAAFLPLCQLALDRGDEDKDLNAVSSNA